MFPIISLIYKLASVKNPSFSCEPHCHVTSGDLRVIENAKLREHVAKGPKYRDNQIESPGKLQKQCFLNPLISMQNIGPRENK